MLDSYSDELPQRADIRKLLRLQDEVARRTVVMPEDYLRDDGLDSRDAAGEWKRVPEIPDQIK